MLSDFWACWGIHDAADSGVVGGEHPVIRRTVTIVQLDLAIVFDDSKSLHESHLNGSKKDERFLILW